VFIEAKDDGGGGDNWSCKACNAPVKSPHQQINTQFLQVGCPSCRPTNSVKALKENITFHGLAYPKLTWGLPTLSLTAPGYLGRVAMPLISPLMPVPLEYIKNDNMISNQTASGAWRYDNPVYKLMTDKLQLMLIHVLLDKFWT